MKYTLTGLGLLLLIFTGCNDDVNPPEVQGQNTNEAPIEHKDWGSALMGPGPINYGAIEEQADPYHPVTEQNSTGTSYRSPLQEHQDFGDDQDMIEDVLYRMEGVNPGMVVLMGGHAWVNVMLDDTMAGQENVDKESRIREIEEELYEVNPRYNYRVVVNDWR
ncbi:MULTISPECIES: hypothetical protein [Bacillaceae]|uniref:Uncharacterized protein n=1 Tax=Evansella alkalicola TaxID=745819 RepID=A0ABS6K0H1_9BACI|nr:MULTISPECIES: hypothetical protein [Bacillaceae]MBU9724356.1 hypothetical protein [Bacillus alkalicola]